MAKVELDVCDTSTTGVEKYGLTQSVLEEAGPAGGCPLVLIEGDGDAIELWIRNVYSPEDPEYPISLIEES